MEYLHINGIHAIVQIQHSFVNWEWLMLGLTQLGNPPVSYFCVFPIAFFLQPRVGVLVIWATCIGEWLNCILKWFLHGERPYWWLGVNQSKLDNVILAQFPSTCETGPGSPSGHCMITGASWFILLAHLSRNQSLFVKLGLRSIFVILLVMIGVSRCFIATHFPHQVAAGIISGVLLGYGISKVNFSGLPPYSYWISAILCLVLAFCSYTLLSLLGVDTSWSISLAKQWCQNPAWIHANTLIVFSFIRQSVTLMGVGFSISLLYHFGRSLNLWTNTISSLKRLLATGLSLLSVHFLHSLPIHSFSTQTFLVTSAVQFFLTPLLVMLIVPAIVGISVKDKQ